jgi:hypothetical protein
VVDNWALRFMIDRAHWTPQNFLPLTVRGGDPIWWYFSCGTLIHVTFLSTWTSLTHYHLPHNPPSEKITKLLIHITSTLHYPLHVTLHYCALPPPPLHCLHISPMSADHLKKDTWKTASARTCGIPHYQGHVEDHVIKYT